MKTMFDTWLKTPLFEAEGPGGAGNDTLEGGDTTPPAGDETLQGADTTAGNDTSAGNDTVTGDDKSLIGGDDSIAAFDNTAIDVEALKKGLPEGVEVNEEQLGEFTKMLNEATSLQDLAGNIVKWDLARQESSAEATATQWRETQEGWQKQIKDSPDFGGDKLDQSLAVAREVGERFGGKDFLQLLNVTGAGNNIAMMKFLHNVHAALPKEPGPINGAPTSTERSLAERIFNPQGAK